ncbi:MAG TPA: hypothetical protein VK664_14700 [Flavitalea sp.]|nr:hypothetical protein [Flavitalea sp.]
MKATLFKEGISLESTSEIPLSLKAQLQDGFRIEEGCILFLNTEYYGPGSLELDTTKNDYELFLNSVEIEFYIHEPSDKNCLTTGLQFSKELLQLLTSTFQERFRVFLKFESQGNYPSAYCKVTFHKIRISIDLEFKSGYQTVVENDAALFIE